MKKQNGLIAAAVAVALCSPVYAADVTISGAVEVEAAMAEDFAGTKTTDIIVATAAVGIDAKINNRVSATVGLLYEEDDAAFDGAAFGLDEAYATLQVNKMSAVSAGRMYVPFGTFDSNMVSDPQTLELGETAETALLLGMASGNITGSVYTFNGDVDEDSELAKGDDAALSFGASLGFANDNLSMGASYISNIAETGSLEGVGTNVKSAVAGMGLSFGYTMGNFSVIAEHVAALESFAASDLGGATANEEQPRATNVEVAMALKNGATIAAAYQVTSETAFLGLPKYVTSVAVTFEAMKDVGLGFEYATMEDFEANGSETATAFTAKLAVEF